MCSCSWSQVLTFHWIGATWPPGHLTWCHLATWPPGHLAWYHLACFPKCIKWDGEPGALFGSILSLLCIFTPICLISKLPNMHYERYLLPGDEKPSWNCLSGKILNGAGLIPLFYFDKWCARKKWNFRGKKNTGNSNPPAFSGQHELFTALTHTLHHSYNLKRKI